MILSNFIYTVESDFAVNYLKVPKQSIARIFTITRLQEKWINIPQFQQSREVVLRAEEEKQECVWGQQPGIFARWQEGVHNQEDYHLGKLH